jgi:filamentous hemagglutinin family protein
MPHVHSAKSKSESAVRSDRGLHQPAVAATFTPIARAIALTLAAGGMMSSAHAVQPFSPAWFANKSAIQATAAVTGLMPNGTPVSSLSPQGQQQAANAQLQKSIDNLAQAARGIAWQQGLQAAQRQKLLGDPSSMPNVPNGLGVGGLDTGSLASSWVNANAPTQTTDANGNIVVDIQQTGDKAIANWNTFNVGRNTIVQFDQASSDWAILNRITDPNMAPSTIEGQIRAPGTVLIVNQNGIVFSGTSQINTRNLVAAAASISDQQFTQNGIYGPDQSTPSFTNAGGNLIVEEGAQISTSAPTSATQGGGYVLLMGQQVSNAGDIETPQGQIEMAAGDNFVIRKGVGTDGNTFSTTRGNEIAPLLNPGSTSGQVINTLTGLLLATEGDITLAGHDVQQNGVAVATTTINTRGTIHLLNSASDTTGSVTLGDGAITAVAIEDDGSTALDSQRSAEITASAAEDLLRSTAASGLFDNLSKLADLEDESRIEIVSGGGVNFDGGSLTLATGGQIEVSAKQRAFVADGAILDVAGQVGVNLAMSSNDVLVNVQGNELRDSPSNRDSGDLFNTNITVDRRDLVEVPASAADPTDRWYTANGLLEVSGYLDTQGHTIGEWAAQGGTIELSGNQVVTQTGSQINLSGGSLNVATGYVAQTWLVGSDGQLYNANNAPAGMTFTGIYKGFEVAHARWGANAAEFFYNPLIAPKQILENGYTAGRDAGSLIVDAPTAVIEGDILATVYNGPQQIRGRDAVDGYDQAQTAVAKAGTLSFGQYGIGGLNGANDTDIQIGNIADITGGMADSDALPADRIGTTWLDASRLNAEGLGELDLATQGNVAINAPLTLANGGALTITAPTVDIAADITAHGGSVDVSNILTFGQNSSTVLTTPSGDAQLTLESGATINTSGIWSNALVDDGDLSGVAFQNGGSVTFDSTQGVTLAADSTIDVSSGGAILATGKTQGGTGGNVTLVSDDAINGTTSTAPMILDGAINAAGVNGGGTLVIKTGQTVVIGDDASLAVGTLAANTPAATSLTLAQSLTIPAGGILPISVIQVITKAPLDTPLPAGIIPADQRINGAPGVVTGAGWTVPPGVSGFTLSGQFNAGAFLPAGTTIETFQANPFPAGTVIPSSVFPHGLTIQPANQTIAAGSVATAAVTYAAGTVVPAGTMFAQAVSVVPALTIKPSMFQIGFANYDVTGAGGVLVTGGTQIDVVEPVYQFTGASFAAPTGSAAADVFSLTLPPLYTQNPAAATLTQRDGASLALRSLSNLNGGSIVVAPDAAMTVDPGQSITLDGFGQITVDGTLTAHSGVIDILSEATGSTAGRNFDAGGTSLGNTIWIGGDAVLDVSAQAATALDQSGRPYGVVADGGTIHLGGLGGFDATSGEFQSTSDFIVIRPGAVLDASGANALIDPNAGAGAGLSDGSFGAPFTLASNGGSIALDSLSGIYNDGTLRAWAGGVQGGVAGAAGGSLSITLETPIYETTTGIPTQAQVPSILTVTQTDQGSGLAANLTPENAASALQFGHANVSADAISAGGFDNVSLFSRDVILFDGNVALTAAQSISFMQGALAESDAAAQVSIAAPYVLFSGSTPTKSDFAIYPTLWTANWASPSQSTQAQLTVDADLIDFQNRVSFGMSGTVDGVAYNFTGFQDADFVSQGDIRFLASTPEAGVSGSTTLLLSRGNFSFTAEQLYPVTGAKAGIVAGALNSSSGNILSGSTITVHRIGDVDPAIPDSVFGQLGLFADTIEQGGVIRAPLGVIYLGGSGFSFTGFSATTSQVDFLAGSITSVSANGLVMPYGGTTDGLTYDYAGTAVSAPLSPGVDASGNPTQGILVAGGSIDVQSGATLDVSGGGDLTGHGFIPGRGGSVDVLTTPLINANPANTFSAAGDKVYAIVPGYGSAYAPNGAENGAGNPGMGQQITIPAGVPGLPAGTYTLLPSTYALLPGAYRVELGAVPKTPLTGAVAEGNGSYMVSGFTGIANTNVKSALASTVLVTPGAAVRDLSQYDEEGYSDFLVANAAQFGNLPPALPADGKALDFSFLMPKASNLPSFSFNGTALFQHAQGGIDGTAILTAAVDSGNGPQNIEVYANATGPTAGFNGVSLPAADIDAIGAPQLQIGGSEGLVNGTSTINVSSTVAQNLYVRGGVTLQAAELVLTADGNIDIDPGATLTTIGMGAAPRDSADGDSFLARSTTLVLSNADLTFTGGQGTGSIVVGAGAHLYSEGSLVFATNGAVDIDPNASYGSRSLQLAAANINIGDPAAIAGAAVPTGVLFDQSLFNQLVAGAGAPGVPALEKLVLSASDAINFFGSTGLDATGGDLQLEINTPAIYGYGGAGDHAILSAGTLIWNGVAGAPGAVMANGPGTGMGSLDINVGTLILGTAVTNGLLDTSAHDRVTYGFSSVNVTATDEVISNSTGSLSVYQSPSTTTGDVFGQSGSGGNLNIATPLLTGSAGSVMTYNAGGVLDITTPAGGVTSSAAPGISGAEIDLNGDSVAISTAVVLPSGKLVINANNDITIGSGARLDVSGQQVVIQGQTSYGFGGDIALSSAQGNVIQQADSTIDISATGNDAGSLTISAIGAGGQVSLGGTLLGASTAVAGDTTVHADGSFSVAAQTLAGGSAATLSADFAALNQTLNNGGVFGSRSFDLRQGDLVIGDGVKARSVTVSLDGGSLTVDGTIDASGIAPGSISLSAKNDLTLASSSVLDAHGTVLQVDSNDAPIDASNKATIELAATDGTLTLAPGSTMNLSAPDGVARGEVELDAQRGAIGAASVAGDETGGDIRIDASGPLNITGAQSIAVNGFWTYSPTDQYGTIVQDNGDGAGGATVSSTGVLGMNQVNARSTQFINAALGNTGLLDRLAGLSAYTDAFHLRPGIEIDSATPNGNLTVAGDIDLSGFRYASLNPDFQKTGVYGSGEPGALVIRAGGNLDIVGSISDGFLPAPATPDNVGWVLQAGVQGSNTETLLPVVLNSGTTFPNTANLSLRYAIPITASAIKANAVIPTQVTLAAAYTIPAGTVLTGPIYGSAGNVLYAAGARIATAVTIPAGTQIGAGSVVPGAGNLSITAMLWPAGASLGVFTASVTLSASATVPFEGIIPSGANVKMTNTTAATRATGSSGTEGTVDALSAMLPEGDLSWSMRLVGGADLDAADSRIVQPPSMLKSLGVSGNLTLADSHYSVSTSKFFYYYYASGKKENIKYIGDPSSNKYCSGYPGHCVAFVTTVASEALPSEVRTGTGDLDLIAGGSFSEQSLYGVYTAGTQSKPIAADGTTPAGTTEASNPFNSPLGLGSGGTLLGAANAARAAVALSDYQAWYPEDGGDVLLSAQGNVSGNIGLTNTTNRFVSTEQVSNWLWRQAGVGQATAWWINFGTYAHTNSQASDASFLGFQGIGTLGGGNLTVIAGGNAGLGVSAGNTSGLDLAVASTGRVLADGTIVQTGGGNLVLDIGGAFNAIAFNNASGQTADQFGSITDLRGDIAVRAGSIGTTGTFSGTNDPADPRGVAFQTAEKTVSYGGPTVIPGDGTVDIATRGNLVLAGAGDGGTVTQADLNGTPRFNANGTLAVSGGWDAWFSLWTPATSVGLFSAGGDVVPTENLPGGQSTQINFYPGTLSIVAASGNIRLLGLPNILELAPSPLGQLDLLAGTSIFGMGGTVGMSGAAMSSMATPDNPAYGSISSFTGGNINPDSPFSGLITSNPYNNPITFGPDTPTTDLHAGDDLPALVYAGVDIVDLEVGAVQSYAPRASFTPAPLIWYMGAKPFQISAGRDIVGTGTASNFILNDSANDISTINAGRDIIDESVSIGGPGLLDVQAGRNLYQGYKGTLESVGPLIDVNIANRSSGAGITAIAGVGPSGPDYADFAKLYFNAANQLPDGSILAGSGKVPHTYDQELLTWLQQRFGYGGASADALAYFLALPSDQQGVFVRQVYYEELTLGGREFNDPASTRFQSYLRGRDAIAALFPTQDAQGNAIAYDGGITMFSSVTGTDIVDGLPVPHVTDAGIHTDFGGAIQILNPGGQTIIGVEGVTPGAGAGLITQGEGDIDIYSEGSVLLGESRIMTTFGGDILAWSATGDINAGRGSKTTVVFTPPRLVYDDLGDVTLSPDVPSTGAGIATLDPIPEVAAGDVDLIAPLGTIDAGEAGIRVSGNVNLAALQVVNAANIEVQGKSTGIPMVAEVNVGALTNASAAASQAVMAAQDVVQRDRNAARQALPSIFTVRVLGFGNDAAPEQLQPDQQGAAQQNVPQGNAGYDPASPFQVLGQGKLDPAQLARLTEAEQRRLPK